MVGGVELSAHQISARFGPLLESLWEERGASPSGPIAPKWTEREVVMDAEPCWETLLLLEQQQQEEDRARRLEAEQDFTDLGQSAAVMAARAKANRLKDERDEALRRDGVWHRLETLSVNIREKQRRDSEGR